MLGKLIGVLPPSWIRAAGRAQFSPVIGPIIRRSAGLLSNRQGTIRYGVGAGLKFDATGGFPGYLLGTTEPLEQQTLAQHLHKGGVFYDIGANIGFYSTLAARIVGADGHVYAFEPYPDSARAIEKNAGLNGFTDRVTVVECALGESSGEVVLETGTASAQFKVSDVATAGAGITVACETIDAYVHKSGVRPPTVVMIDVEGFEVPVLRGMTEMIRQYRPTILCEVHWVATELTVYFEQVLRPLGYRFTQLDGSEIPATPQRYHALMHFASSKDPLDN